MLTLELCVSSVIDFGADHNLLHIPTKKLQKEAAPIIVQRYMEAILAVPKEQRTPRLYASLGFQDSIIMWGHVPEAMREEVLDMLDSEEFTWERQLLDTLNKARNLAFVPEEERSAVMRHVVQHLGFIPPDSGPSLASPDA